MKLLAVTGNPILYSASPQIHNYYLNLRNIDAKYLRMHALSGKHALEFAERIGIQALNVTAPFKEQIAKLVDCNEISSKLGAVNTVVNKKNSWYGYNTDVIGVQNSIKNHIDESTNAVILGSGGAAKAATLALKELKIPVTIIARDKTQKEFFNSIDANFTDFEDGVSFFNNANLIISTLPESVKIPSTYKFNKDSSTILLDAIYKGVSYVSDLALQSNVKIISGLTWLIEQAKSALEIFLETKISDQDFLSLPNLSAILKNKNTISNLYLIGMMGSSKTSTINELIKLSKDGCDLDSYISQKENQTIADIFTKKGEAAFRELEYSYLKNLNHKIISCGGGVTTFKPSEKFLKDKVGVWLYASASALSKRIFNDSKNHRPLLEAAQSTQEIEIKLKNILESRFTSYAKSSELIIDSEYLNPDEIADIIINEANL